MKVGNKVVRNEYQLSKDKDAIENELEVNTTYEVEEVGLGLGLVRLKYFIPLVRTKYIKKA